MNDNDVEVLKERIAELEADLLSAQYDYAGAMADLDHFEPLANERKEIIDFLESQNEKLAEVVEDLQSERDELQDELKDCKTALNKVIEHFSDFFRFTGESTVDEAWRIVGRYDIDI